jgi:hypothetical protein
VTLEEQLIALMEAHDLSSISVGLLRSSEPDIGIFPNVYAQGGGECGSCGHPGEGLAAAVRAALADLAAKRERPLSPESLPAIEGIDA